MQILDAVSSSLLKLHNLMTPVHRDNKTEIFILFYYLRLLNNKEKMISTVYTETKNNKWLIRLIRQPQQR